MPRKKKNEFTDILKKIPEDKKKIAANIIDELLFMKETLADLKSQVKENGTVEHFKQGKQNFLRESPALKSYNTTVQRYSQLYKQLIDILPKTPDSGILPGDELLDFMNSEE